MEQAAKRARPEGAPHVDEDVNDVANDSGEAVGEECGEGGDESGDEGEGSGEDRTLAPSQYGANTPTGPLSKLKVVGVWQHIKRLKDPELREKKGQGKEKPFTHVCVLCWDLPTLTRDKEAHGRFLTTLALTHLRKFHSQIDLSVKSQEGLDAKGRHRTISLLFAGSRLSSSSAKVGPAEVASAGLGPSYYVSASDLALSKCAHFYVYGKAHLPKQLFDDAEFRGMCQGFYEAGGGGRRTCASATPRPRRSTST